MAVGTSCLKCKRWKLWDEAPCPEHPDFKTAKEIDEAEKWRKADEGFRVMTYVAALRTTSAFMRKDLFDNAWRNLHKESLEVVERVVAEVRKLGPMTASEITSSIFMAARLKEGEKNR